MTYENYRHWIINRITVNSVTRDNGCIEYAGGGLKHKYGLISITLESKRKSVPASRAMYMAVNDCLDMPRSIVIRHTCNNPCCVNIEHLKAGTPKDNSADCLERGRRAKTHKLHTRHRLLTDEQVMDIKTGNQRPSYYCWKYNITAGYVSKLRNGIAKPLLT